MVTLIVGSTGAGKTTYAKRLEKETAAAVYSIDDWMKALYWPDMPANPDNQWFIENSKWYTDRISRCEDLILQLTFDRARRNENTLLDLGFSTAEHRQRFIQALSAQGISVETHYLDVPAELRWQRVQKRNSEKGETFAMTVDRQMFDFIESIFEPPHSSEGAPVHIVTIT